ncbi:MAG TPA: hypothetical protein VNO34_00220 [Actinomycetota bacterium]|nr:hypothetical protein [Actinomycetota bacterium]
MVKGEAVDRDDLSARRLGQMSSLCPRCLRLLPAESVERDDGVIVSVKSFWFDWASFFPETAIFGTDG